MNDRSPLSTQLSETERSIITGAGLKIGPIEIILPKTRKVQVISPTDLITTKLTLPTGDDAAMKLKADAERVVAREAALNGRTALWALTQNSGRHMRDIRHGKSTIKHDK